jgi:hypothetical protein
MTQPVHHFRAGDRVQLIRSFGTVAVGTYGTVLTRFLGSLLYDVRFDGHKAPYIILESYLAPVSTDS